MENLLKKLKKYTQVLYWILIFLITAILLFLILPAKPKFKYEYQKGFPWKHENLIAPFDFAILKTTEEIEREKEEQLNSVIPYFSVDTTILNNKLTLLQSNWNKLTESASDSMGDVLSDIRSRIKKIYKAGILPRSPETYEILNNRNELKKIYDHNAIKIPVGEVYSEKTAYNKIINAFAEIGENHPEAAELIKSLSPVNYIEANLAYDSETTQKEINNITNDISVTRGMIQTGERIILEGEIVNDEKYQILESLKESYEKERINGMDRHMILIGRGVLIMLFVLLIFLYLYIYRYDLLVQYRKLTFMLLFLVTIVVSGYYINSFPNLHIYMVPFIIFPVIIRTFFDSRTAIFTLIIASILTGFFAPNGYEFVLLQVTAGIVAVFSLNKMHRRVHLVMAVIWVFITYVLVFIALELIYENNITSINYKMLQWFAISSILLLLVYPLIFIFEKIFGFVSDVTLIELADTNQPLLRKLAEKAPGTFQHSILTANLSEEIILKIGGNPFRVRAGALYHDMGKIAEPAFFIENQDMGINPHDKMSYKKSAEKIIEHVNRGVKMARKHKLPESLIEFIATHHGTTKAQYFYLKHQEENPEEKVDDNLFSYPGPLPKTKEAAVVMIVDGIEAASRSMKDKNPKKLKELIDKMVDQKIRDNQLKQSELTFHDIDVIKETLLNKLMNIYHIRIEYPEENNTKPKKDKKSGK